jgi:FAD/FMN-containing dehydrogenase
MRQLENPRKGLSLVSSITPEMTSTFAGPMFSPGDPGYVSEVTGFNLASPRTPDFAVGAVDATDVANAVRYARNREMPVSVIGGRRGSMAITTGLAMTTHRMNAVRTSVDPDGIFAPVARQSAFR